MSMQHTLFNNISHISTGTRDSEAQEPRPILDKLNLLIYASIDVQVHNLGILSGWKKLRNSVEESVLAGVLARVLYVPRKKSQQRYNATLEDLWSDACENFD